MWGAGTVLGAHRVTKLLPTKAKSTRSDTHTLPFLEGAVREGCCLQLSGSGDGIWHYRAVLDGRGGQAKHLGITLGIRGLRW